MLARDRTELVIVGAGAAGLMAGYRLARAGKRVTILEARSRCGGRILSLPPDEFGYPAEGGAEFVHGAAGLTRELMREGGLSLAGFEGTRWRAGRGGVLSPSDRSTPHVAEFRRALIDVQSDMPIAEFLARHFADPQYAELRRYITRMVEGYDAADPRRASTFAIRDEWLDRETGQQGRIAEGYGALIAFLLSKCRFHGAAIRFNAIVVAIDADAQRVTARCEDGSVTAADFTIVTLPIPLLSGIALPPLVRAKLANTAEIGFGNVVKILLRFTGRWWTRRGNRDLADLSFLSSDAAVPTWWTQHPAPHPVLTGWLAGPASDAVVHLGHDELVDLALNSLAGMFGIRVDGLRDMLVACRAINWATDRFARGAYSFATPRTRHAQSVLQRAETGIYFAGEALYTGPQMGTVEAALASGAETAEKILSRPV